MKKFKFISLSLIMAVVMAAFGFMLLQFEFSTVSFAGIIAGISVSLLGGIGSYILISRGLTKAHGAFFSGLIKGMLLKILLGLLAVVIVMFLKREIVNEFVASFFLSYFIFTAFEVYSLMRNLRPENEKPPEVAENIKVSGQNESKT